MSHSSSPTATLQEDIVRLFESGALAKEDPFAMPAFERFREALTHGEIRAAEKRGGEWHVNTWVKQGILLGFRIGKLHEWHGHRLPFVGKHTFPPRQMRVQD